MVDETLKIMKSLSDETRLKIVKLLLNKEKCVCEIFPHIKRTQSTTSIQLGKLEESGILKSRREGKKVLYSIKDKRIHQILQILENKKFK